MTAKRFTLEEFGLNFIVNDDGRSLTARQTVELLNELHEENQRYKRIINQQEIELAKEINDVEWLRSNCKTDTSTNIYHRRNDE